MAQPEKGEKGEIKVVKKEMAQEQETNLKQIRDQTKEYGKSRSKMRMSPRWGLVVLLPHPDLFLHGQPGRLPHGGQVDMSIVNILIQFVFILIIVISCI